jgi:hypothetical protein
LLYTGRDNKTSHKGMGISESDWEKFIAHLIGFIESTKADIVE